MFNSVTYQLTRTESVVPFDCGTFVSVKKICNNINNNNHNSSGHKQIVIVHQRHCCTFNIYKYFWTTERMIWIAFYKNNENDQCLINKLPKDLIIYILVLLGKKQVMVTPYIII